MKYSILSLIILTSFLSSCSLEDLSFSDLNRIDQRAKLDIKKLAPELNNKQRRSFVKVKTVENELLNSKIRHLNIISQISIKQAILMAIPRALVIAEDTSVDLSIPVQFNIKDKTYKQFFSLLSSLTGYKINIDDELNVLISSASHKRWNISALVNLPNTTSSVGGNAKAGSAGGSTSISLGKSNDTWEDLLSGLKSILGSSGVVVDNKRLGEIYALGEPQKLAIADKWMQKMIDQSQKQINLDVAILEVTLDDGSASGINWDAFYNQGTPNSAQLSRSGTQDLSGGGLWNLVGNYVSGKFNIGATINFLRKQGKVNVQHHPSLTTTNGSTAYLGSAEQFSYIASIKNEIATTTNGTGTTVVSTPTIETIDVGVNIAMTARILDNNEILVEVVPVISSLQSVETLHTDSNGTIKAPRITLQELSTQVITKSGQPIHLGGMSSEKIIESGKNVPGFFGKVFNLFFQSESKEFEKKEVLLIITPTEI
jgi:hypothetical protein